MLNQPSKPRNKLQVHLDHHILYHKFIFCQLFLALLTKKAKFPIDYFTKTQIHVCYKEVLEFIDELEHNQNQKAIECLKEVWKDFEKRLFTKKWDDKVYVAQICNMINDIFDNKIKELEESDE